MSRDGDLAEKSGNLLGGESDELLGADRAAAAANMSRSDDHV